MTLTQINRKYGWKPSAPDPRNIPTDTTGLPVVLEVDPRAELPAVYDQGQLGSCTGNAVAAAFQYENILNGTDYGVPSRLFIYYGEREREGTTATDSGAYGHDGFKVLRTLGAPPEDLWPYIIDQYATKPSQAAYDAATAHKLTSEYRHPGLSDASLEDKITSFKQILSNQQTIAFGFTVYESFESSELAQTGIMSKPDPSTEKVLGGHEVLVVGYLEDYPDHCLIRNSWGTNWGIGGYFLAPWEWLLDPKFCSDWRTIYRQAK